MVPEEEEEEEEEKKKKKDREEGYIVLDKMNRKYEICLTITRASGCLLNKIE